MNFFCQINKQTLLLWSLLLSVALLCAQGAKLHVHDLNHEHDSHIHTPGEASNHGQMSKPHFIYDMSHDHDDVISEIDISPDGLLKSFNNSVFSIALFTLFFTLITFVSLRQRVRRCRESQLVLHKFYVLSPPLRAPPAY